MSYKEAGAAFQPGTIGRLTLKNRLIVPAMVVNSNQPDGMPTERYIQYHEEKARGGWGMIITEDWIYRCAESACPVFWKSPVRTEEITVPDR